MIRRSAALAVLVAVVTIIFLPGSLVPDTLDMYHQALTDRYSDWHSPIFAGAWGLFDTPPELILAAQNVAFVSAVYLLLAHRMRPWRAVLATWIIALFPTTLGWLGHLGKDQWFAAAMLWSLTLLARANGERPSRQRIALLLGACAAAWLAVAARQNALIPVALVFLVAVPPDLVRRGNGSRAKRAAVRVTVAGAITAAIFVTQALWTDQVVQPTRTFPQQPTYQFDLAALSVRTGELLLPRSSLQPGVDLEDLSSHVTYEDGGGSRALFFNPDSPVRFMISDPEVQHELEAAWRRAVLDHPIAYLRHRLAYTAGLLAMTTTYPEGALIADGSQPETFGFPESLHERYFPSIYDFVSSGLRTVESTGLVRGWWLVLLLGTAAFALGVRDIEARALVTAGLANVATFAALGVAGNYRYVWFSSLCALILSAIAIDRWFVDREPPVREQPPIPAAPPQPGEPSTWPAESAEPEPSRPASVRTMANSAGTPEPPNISAASPRIGLSGVPPTSPPAPASLPLVVQVRPTRGTQQRTAVL